MPIFQFYIFCNIFNVFVYKYIYEYILEIYIFFQQFDRHLQVQI